MYTEVMNKQLSIIAGGVGTEREVSLLSGRNIVDSLRAEGVECEEIIVGVDKSFIYKDRIMSEVEGLEFLKKENALVFQVVHGTYGEDGEFVRKLEEYGITYIGSNSDVLAKTINKSETESLLREHLITTTKSVLVKDIYHISKVGELQYPLIIKPNKEGSSIGVIKVKEESDLRTALEKSLDVYDEVVVQTCVEGREFTCGVIEIDGKEIALTPSEVVLENGMLFDYNAKYFVNGLEITPAAVDEEMMKKIQNCAIEVHKVMGCKDISRTDMILNEKGELVVLEINTVPGMTSVSFIPAEMKASGYSLKDFVEGMIKKMMTNTSTFWQSDIL